MKSNTTKVSASTSPHLLRKNQHPVKSVHHRLKSKSTQFISKAERFHYEYSKNPGPGSYEPPLKERHTSDYHISRDYANQATISQEHMWIISRGRQLFDTLNHWKANVGPGKYHRTKHSKEQDHSGWGKNVRFNYDQTERKSNLGPGSYVLGNNLINKKLVAGSAFNSKSTKSHFEEMLKERAKLHQAKLNPQCEFGQIQQKKLGESRSNEKKETIKKRNHGSPNFMSKIDRLPKLEADRVGPGSYDLDATFRKEQKRRVLTEIKSSPSRQYIILNHQSSKVISPGPGAYNIQKNSEPSQKSNKKSLLGMISRQGRFKSSNLNDRHLQTEPNLLTLSQKQQTVVDFQKGTLGRSELKSVYTILRKMQKEKEQQCKILQTEPHSQQ